MKEAISAYLSDNPKMTGVLFMAMLLLSQAAPAAANVGAAMNGP